MQSRRAANRPTRLRAIAHANPVRAVPPPGATGTHAILLLRGCHRAERARRTALRTRPGLSGLGQARTRLSACYFFAGSVDEDDEVPLPVVDDEEAAPGVPVPVVPVGLVPDVEPALPLLVPAVLPVPVPLPLVLGLPMPLPLPVVALLLDLSLPEGEVVDDDDEVGGGGVGATTVVEDDDAGGVLEPVVGGVSWRCWQAESVSRMLAATAVRIGRFIVAPSVDRKKRIGAAVTPCPGFASNAAHPSG